MTNRQKPFLKSKVIHDYLNEDPRNKIADDNDTSTGNVSNIVGSWKKGI
jgi:hypothetical protein